MDINPEELMIYFLINPSDRSIINVNKSLISHIYPIYIPYISHIYSTFIIINLEYINHKYELNVD